MTNTGERSGALALFVVSAAVALLAAAVAVPPPAAPRDAAGAEDAAGTQQTPENAHRFLSLIAEQQNIFTYPTRNTWPAFGAQYKVALSQEGPCATRVDGRIVAYNSGQGWINVGTPQFNPKRLAALHAQHRLPPPPYTI